MLSNTRELRSLRLAVGRVRRGDAGAKYNTGGDQQLQLHSYSYSRSLQIDYTKHSTPHILIVAHRHE